MADLETSVCLFVCFFFYYLIDAEKVKRDKHVCEKMTRNIRIVVHSPRGCLLVVVVSAWVSLKCGTLSLLFLYYLPFLPSLVSFMSPKSLLTSLPLSPQSSSAQPKKRPLFARSSSKSSPKNTQVQSAPPPSSNPVTQTQSQSTQSDTVASSLSAPTALTTTSPSPSSPPPPMSQNGVTKSDTASSSIGTGSQEGPVPAVSQPAAEQASAQATTTSTTTVGSLSGTAASSALAASEPADDTDREKERDKGSLSTTLTGTHHTRVSRKGAPSASEGAHSSTAAERPSTPNSAVKHRLPRSQPSLRVSFISRLFRALIPCIGPTRLPTQAANEVVADPDSSAAALREKPSTRDAEKDSSLRPVQETPITSESLPEQPHPSTELPSSPSGAVAEPSLWPLQPPTVTSDNDLDIVIPPTPTRIIPESETGGVTSSAVVPPGSTAEEVAQLRAQQLHESGDESDGTSFTEEEVEDVSGIDGAEDDEDRLILNGGAGIPIGPVSARTSLFSTLLDLICPHRMGFPDLSYPQSPHNMSVANALS
jgi:hypothetical protein